MLRHVSRLLLLVLGLALASQVHSATQTLTILGANGVAGAIEPNTDYSKDGGVTWHPAYLFTGHPWGYINGTNAWLNQDPSPFVGLNDRVDFRIRFFLPSTWTNAQMTYQVNADNEADILLNGTQLVHTVGGPISSGSLATQYLVPGINIVYVRLIDYGGWVGLNYRIDLSMDASQPIQLLSPPPSITSSLTASGTVNSPFSYNITATNSPTSFAASGLPSGLTVNSATGVISGTPTAAGTYSIGLTASSNFGSGSNTLVLTIGKAAATVTLSNLTQTYDGTVKSASASTSPAGLLVDFTYTGGSVPPINVGLYTVFGVINNANYAGNTSAAFRINPAAAAVTLSNLSQAYDGSPKPVTVTTVPASLARTVTYNGSTTVPAAVGSYPIVATVTNPNYTGSATGTLVISDVTPPVLTLPANLVVEATSAAGAVVTFSATATDNVTASPAIGYSKASGSTFALGVTTVTVTATDAAGNISSGTFTVTVRDTTAPAIAAISNLVAEAASAAGAAVTFGTTANDLVSGSVAVTGSPASGSTFALGDTTVTLHATDAAGNIGTSTFTVTVRDTTKPVLTLPTAPIVAEATSPAGAPVSFATSATDSVSGSVLVTTSAASGSTFALGNTTVTASATDAAGNRQTGTFTITVRDTTAPVITQANLVTEATSPAGAVATFAPTATDLVSGNVTVNSSIASGRTFVVGTTPVTLTATDAAGNTATSVFTVTVTDTTAPVIAAEDNLAVEATSAAGAVVTFTPSASDIVSGAVSVSASPASGSTFALGTTSVALTTQDAAGNHASSAFAVTVVDTTAPVIATPAAITAEATSPTGASVSFNPTATDLVDGVVSVSASPASGSTFAIGTTTVTLNTVDAHGNAATSTFNVTVVDTTKPTLTVPADQILEATSPAGAIATFTATATDAVTATPTIGTSIASGSVVPLGATVVNVTATDAAGNVAHGSFTITVKDTTAPVITQANLVTEATGPLGAVVSFSPTATDLVSGSVAVNSSVASGSAFAVGTTPVTLTATDAAGNVATHVFSVTVTDTTAPVIAAQDNLIAEATSAAGAVVTFTPSASDLVSGAVSVTASPASGSVFALGTTNVALATQDAAGNAASGSFTVTVVDTTAPVIATPAALTAEATSPAGAVVTFAPTASDLVDGPVAVTASPASGSTFAIGTTTVTLTSVDAHGNSATSSFTVTVADTTAPVLTTPVSQTIEATGADGAVATFAASATDAVGATLSYSLASGSTFALGVTTVNVTATDAAGNHSDGSFTITVRDTTAPVIAAPANIVIEATGAAGAVATFTSSATDLVDGAVAVTSSIASGSTFPVGTTAITLTATDAAGNAATAVFSVTVTDTTAPVIAAQDNLIVEATSAAGAIVTFTPSSLDIVSGAVGVVAMPASGSTFALGVTTVTLTATDAAGNSAAKTFTVTVVDTTAPVIATPANIVAEATSAAGAVVTFNLAANDLVDGAVAVSASPAPGSTFPIGTTTVTLSTHDAAGNAASSTFTVTVRDTIAPVIAPVASQTLEATGPAGAIATFATTATDAVGATISYVPAPGSVFALGTNTVTVTARDAAANTSTAAFTITVRDTTVPVLSLPASQTLEATGPAGAIATFSATALDLVSGSLPVAFTANSGSTFALGTTLVTASAADAAHNVATGGFTITVRDTTPPVLTAPANQILEATGPGGAIATFSASATDLVSGNLPVVASKLSGSTFALGTTTVTLIATDAAHNSTTKTFTVTVRDTTAPTLTVPADLVVDSATVLGATATFAVSATDLVSGALPVTLSKASGTTFPMGTTAVTATVTDAAGNVTTKTFNVTVRAPAAAVVNELSANNGTINGSIQQLTAAGTNLNGGGKLTGELLVIGTPTLRLNGNPTFGGTVDGTGSASPSNYTITLNGGATLGRLVRRMNPIALPTVAAPANPTGTRGVNLNRSTDSIGAWSTLKDLTLNGNVGSVTVPAGIYGSFTANGGSGFILGVAGATTPSVYQFQSLTLNGNSTFSIVGPVIIIVKNGLNANGAMGSSAHPEWLDLRISNGGLTLNCSTNFQGFVTAPTGTVTVNGDSQLVGGLSADKLVVNGGGILTLLRR